MNALLMLVPKPILLGLVVAFGLLAGMQSCRVDNLQEENAAYEVAVEQCAKTNKQNKTVVAFLKLQQTKCLDGRRADETNLANQVAAWNAERELLTEKAEEIELHNVEVYREPSCAELAQMDITNVCPTFVDRLRERAESYNRVRNGND